MQRIRTRRSHLRARLLEVLLRSETWLRQSAALPGVSPELTRVRHQDADTIRRMRTRAASALLNVAMFGAFSSGKSFLISGLQGTLEVIEVPGDSGLPAEKFVGLLPSSPEPTTACPAQVVPVEDEPRFDTSGRGYLRARFADSDNWENVGNSPAPAVVAAYAMQGADVRNRLAAHWNREVAEIEILLSRYRIPAKLYDLPGYGSPNAIHDAIVKAAMSDADCFIYVTHANRTLSENDLDLIRALYEHCRVWKKRVIWVLTAIDAATHLDHRNIPAWRTIIDQNNRYLNENFKIKGEPDRNFIGEGFMPVSPASEARAARHAADGEEASARRHGAASQMDPLRQILCNLIEQEAGRKHIAELARGARGLVVPWARTLDERLRAERLPIDELTALLATQRDLLIRVDTEILRLREELESALRVYVKRAARPFDHLAAHLHAQLDDVIRGADVRNPRKANEIYVTKTQIAQAWLEASEGPSTIWSNQVTQFKKDILRSVRRRFDETDQVGNVSDYSFDADLMTLPRPQRRITAKQDIVQRTAVVVGVAAPIGATAAWIASAVAAGVVFPPAAALVGAAAVAFMGVQFIKRKATSLEVTQQEWISALDAEAKEIRNQFELATGSQGMRMIDNLADNLDEYRMQLEESVDRNRERVADPKYQVRQEFVERLEPLCKEGAVITAALEELANLEASRIVRETANGDSQY